MTIGPMRTRSVAIATAASVIHGSAMSVTGARYSMWSHTNTPSQPAASASAARSATSRGSASSPKIGRKIAQGIAATVRHTDGVTAPTVTRIDP